MSKQLIGRVLWFRERDGFGVITDLYGADYYFHRSEINHRSASVQKGSIVSFHLNEEVTDCPCASRISALDKNTKAKITKSLKELSL